MNKPLTKVLFVLCFYFSALNVSAQSTGLYYSNSNSSTTYNAIAGTIIHVAGTDDAVSAAIPMGMTFKYGGEPFTQLWISSNGWVSLLNPLGNSYPVNNLATTTIPIIAPLWDDLRCSPANGAVRYQSITVGGQKIFKIEWQNMRWNNLAPDSTVSFELWLYGDTASAPATSNQIKFQFLRVGVSALNAPSASSGFSGLCPGDFYADTTNSGGSPLLSFVKTADLANQTVKYATQQVCLFTPLVHPNDWAAAAQNTPLSPNLPLQQYTGSTFHSTRSTTVPIPACWTAADTFDVWFKIVKPAGISNFEIFTDQQDCRGAAYNPKMAVYTDTTAAAIACDATNSGGVVGATSSIYLTNQSCVLSTTYYVRITTSKRAYFRFNIRPPGRDCSYANQICGIPYASPLNLSTCGFGNDYDSTNSACHTPREEGEDYLFVYTPASGVCVDISLNNTPANSYPGLTVYQGCPTTGNCLANVSGPGVAALTFTNMSLVAGVTYYFAVDYDANGGFISCMNNFDLTINTSGAPTPAYDNCASPAGPVPVTIGASCTGLIDYNNNCASPSVPGIPLPGCGSFIDGITPDVWFTFTSTSNQPHQIDVSPGTIPAAQDLAMAVYTSSGGSCGPFSLVVCDDNSNVGMPSATVVPPGAGQVYYMRVWSNSGTQTGNFRICVVAGCSPANDLPCAAQALTIGTPVNGDNACSSGAGEPGNATCWGAGNTLNTVWYSFVASATTMKIRTRLFTLYDSQIAVYTGPCGVGMLEVAAACNNDYVYNCGQAFTTKASDLTVNGLSIGTTYYVRVDGRTSNTGTFEIIVVAGATAFPPVPSQDCALPINVCSNSTFNVADPGYSGAGNYCDVGGAGTCMTAGEASSTWYTMSMTGPATLQWLLTTSSSNDYDWMVWCIDTVWNNNPNHVFSTVANYCSNLNNPALFPWTTCNVSHIDNTGMNISAGLDTVGGTLNQHRNVGGGSTPPISQAGYIPAGMTATFLISINNWSNTTVGFTFNWQGSAINGNPPSMTWQNAATSTWATRANWIPSSCGNVPDCGNQIPATIAAGGIQPVIGVSCSVKDITINAGASLTINAGVTLSVCGNFTNNGSLNCLPGSIVKFIGNSSTSINGTFGAVLNNFYNVEFAKGSAAASVTLNTNIYIQGYDSIYGGIVNNNNKNTEVGGNFYNYNGATSFIGLGAGVGGSTLTFTRRSGNPQLYTNLVSALTLNNVTMNQVAASTVTLNNGAFNNMIIGASGVLTLTQGRIITGVREVNVTNSASAACTAGNNTSYVEGDLRRAIAMGLISYDFPVGDGTSAIAPGIVGYQRANITYSIAPSGTYNLLAHFYRWTLGGVAFPGNGPAASECLTATYSALPTFNHGYWRIDASIGAPTGTYRATLYNQNMSNSTGSGWTVVKGTSGSGAFSLSGACWAASTAAQTRRDNLTGFSDFTTVQSQTPLPIQLLYFNAEPNGHDVQTSWVTATEVNNDHFELERSKDGNEFIKITDIKGFGAGVSTHSIKYNFNDKDICDAVMYYRLKQVDIDRNFSYSNVAAVNCKDADRSITVFPNPANTLLNVNFSTLVEEKTEVQIVNMVGMIVMQKELNAQSGFNSASFEIKDLPSGVYYLVVKNDEENELSRQVKFLKY